MIGAMILNSQGFAFYPDRQGAHRQAPRRGERKAVNEIKEQAGYLLTRLQYELLRASMRYVL